MQFREARTVRGIWWLGMGLMLWGGLVGRGSGGTGELFPDPGLEAAVRSQVFAKRTNREPLVEADVAQVSTITARGRDIRSLAGLEKCRNLAMLDVGENRISDLAPLAGLGRLQYLDLQNNEIGDVSPLAGVAALQYLHLGGNAIEDAAPLAGLTNLAALYLNGNRLVDVIPFLGLRRLTSLYLDDNRVVSIEGIGRLEGLSSLSLNGNRISDLRPLKGLKALQFLFLERNRLRDLGALKEWLEADSEQRFAPYVQIHVKGNPLSSEARRQQLESLRESGVRIVP